MPSRTPRGGRVQLRCLGCGTAFETFKAWLRGGRGGKYCSVPCSAKYRPKRKRTIIRKDCAECGKTFERRLGSGGRATTLFCSIKCMAITRGRNTRGEHHPNWKGGVSKRTHQSRVVVKQAVKAIGRCERCGAIDHLHGHHKEKWSESPSLRECIENIEVICANCHAQEHPELAGMLLYPHRKFGVTLECKICQQPFYVPQYKAKTAKFCSWNCKNESQRGIRRKAA